MAAAAPGELTGANRAFVAAFAVVKLVERERARAKLDNAGKVNEELEVREVVNWARANGRWGLSMEIPEPRLQRSSRSTLASSARCAVTYMLCRCGAAGCSSDFEDALWHARSRQPSPSRSRRAALEISPSQAGTQTRTSIWTVTPAVIDGYKSRRCRHISWRRPSLRVGRTTLT